MARSIVPICGAATLSILVHSATSLGADVECFVDNVNGSDTNTGLTEAQAVLSQAKIPSTCTVAKFKRGNVFNEAVKMGYSSKITTYTNYGNSCDPLPKFVMPGTKNTGTVVSSNTAGVTIDGLYLANSHGDGSSSSFGSGVCVQIMGKSSVVKNCEITSCDIGVMMMGEGSKFLNNYVHDLNTMIVDASQDSGVNINAVGGAEGIFVSSSNIELAYNQFINCTTTAAWTGGSCDGGATEVSIGSGTLSGLKVHHNFAYNTCGFFEASSGGTGTLADAEFYDNVSVDSGWMFLLQVNNTKFSNVRWENNTLVYHGSSTSSFPPTISMIYNGTGTAGVGNAVLGGVDPETVFFNNNLVIFDGYSATANLTDTVVTSVSQSNNKFVNTATTTGVVKNVGASATMPLPTDFELVAGSPAIDQGMPIASITLDYLNRAVPAGSAPDVGAFEYDSSLAADQSIPVSTQDLSTGKVSTGCSSTGGAPSTGGAKATATGGAPAAGGSSAQSAGGTQSSDHSSASPSTGGAAVAVVTGGAANIVVTGGSANATGGAANVVTATGGAVTSDAGANTAGGAQAGIAGANSATGGADPIGETATAASNTRVASVAEPACSCRVPGKSPSRSAAATLASLLMLGLGVRRNRRNCHS